MQPIINDVAVSIDGYAFREFRVSDVTVASGPKRTSLAEHVVQVPLHKS